MIAIIITLLLIVGAIFIMYASQISAYLEERARYYSAKQKELLVDVQLKTGERPKDAATRLAVTNEMLNLIDDMIEAEILYKIQSLILISRPYDLKNIPDDIKAIAIAVKDGIKPEVFQTSDFLLTDDYIFDYIVSSVSSKLLQAGQTHNLNMREG